MEHRKPDVILKNFWRDNERFASLFNTVVFKGKPVVRPEDLREMDTEVSNIIELKNHRETIVRSRDVVKKTAHGVDFVILGIENQQKTHFAMPLRMMLYDALGYLKESEGLVRYNRKNKELVSAEEFLSGLKKTDRLHPIISIVIHYDEHPWEGPLTLKDMIVDMPEEIAAVFSDYRMNLLQVRESGRYHFDNEDIQTVFEVSQYIFAEKFGEIEKKYENRDIKAELAIVIGTITESDHIVKQAVESKGGMVNMCSALEKLEKRGLQQGIRQRNEEIICRMLKKGMDRDLIKEITGADEATIERLYRERQM